ncbi:hypothetical protein BC829DRAFT_387195 [Chytridium lagenaria]|nr:hypothetical protein BC829DRAFT_387195 [Chytridium lagenaria]
MLNRFLPRVGFNSIIRLRFALLFVLFLVRQLCLPMEKIFCFLEGAAVTSSSSSLPHCRHLFKPQQPSVSPAL